MPGKERGGDGISKYIIKGKFPGFGPKPLLLKFIAILLFQNINCGSSLETLLHIHSAIDIIMIQQGKAKFYYFSI